LTPREAAVPRTILGLDVGGANLKAAWYPGGPAVSYSFALWRDPGGLTQRLRELVGGFPRPDIMTVTMTAELCDCYSCRSEGVRAVLDAVESVAPAPVRVWTTAGHFVDPGEAREHLLEAASANWLALAAFAARHLAPAGPGLLLDVGSTTTDIVPVHDGRPVPHGRTDHERLPVGELVYTGVRRTPVCALVHERVAAELFATTLDVYLLLGLRKEDPSDTNTADGAPATREAAEERLARMLGADRETSRSEERWHLARRVFARQVKLVVGAAARVVRRMPAAPAWFVLAGEGEFLARRALPRLGGSRRIISLTRRLGAEISNAACAYAVAVLGAEEQA
jgi:probable H4MPT-linked C1 transfer pathway protein